MKGLAKPQQAQRLGFFLIDVLSLRARVIRLASKGELELPFLFDQEARWTTLNLK